MCGTLPHPQNDGELVTGVIDSHNLVSVSLVNFLYCVLRYYQLLPTRLDDYVLPAVFVGICVLACNHIL